MNDEPIDLPPISDEDLSNIELSDADRADLNSKNLKSKKIEDLTALANKLLIENAAGLRRQGSPSSVAMIARRAGRESRQPLKHGCSAPRRRTTRS